MRGQRAGRRFPGRRRRGLRGRGRLGAARQWLSWIGLDEYYRALWDERTSGPVNAVAPDPVRNADYAETLAGVLHRRAVLPVPSVGPRLLLGAHGARELAEADQRVVPTKLLSLGHRFRYRRLADALAHQLGHGADATQERNALTSTRTRLAAAPSISLVRESSSS